MTYDLSQVSWQLSGWQPYAWRWAFSMENLCLNLPDVPAIPATVPGSVQKALQDASLLPDWHISYRSRECEWVENRNWMYSCTLDPNLLTDKPFLHCEGLDGAGEVLLNKKTIGRFDNAFVPHDFDLSDFILPDQPNRLDLVFFTPPRALGQINRTSRITEKKPRFNYHWDWCNRLVQIGIWDKIELQSSYDNALARISCSTTEIGILKLEGHIPASCNQATIHLEVFENTSPVPVFSGEQILTEDFDCSALDIHIPHAKLWYPNGAGPQNLYQLEISIYQESSLLARRTITTGFSDIKWKKNPGAPENADPWLCVVNSKETFLQGVNWTPIRANFADVTDDMIRDRLEIYAKMGCNVLRIWGGAVLEKEYFFQCCDELGLMVIQEFPFSSSGIDNFPPESPEAIQAFGDIAISYLWRRRFHPSILAWCGGNELQWGFEEKRKGVGIPIGLEHPMLANFASLCQQMDPLRRFLPSSPSGPRVYAGAEFGEGLHWDVHGPWHLVDGTLEGQKAFWDNDDALFRSEAGVPGATTLELIEKYAGELDCKPFEMLNPFWRRYYYYRQYELFEAHYGRQPESLAEYVPWSQQIQAEALAIAAESSKNRFPACGGIIIWMGHDAWPCPENTSLINYDGTEKPAVAALQKIFTRKD